MAFPEVFGGSVAVGYDPRIELCPTGGEASIGSLKYRARHGHGRPFTGFDATPARDALVDGDADLNRMCPDRREDGA
jgi:hypothetical protein